MLLRIYNIIIIINNKHMTTETNKVAKATYIKKPRSTEKAIIATDKNKYVFICIFSWQYSKFSCWAIIFVVHSGTYRN